jgi:superkiller protein 3
LENKRNYTKAIQSFQAAIRCQPTDVHAWVGLGEAYANSGRHSAAIKAFAKAEALDPGNWYARYILGNVQKDVSEYDEACATFRDIISDHPGEFSVLLSLAQTLLLWASTSFRVGEFSNSIDIALEGVAVAKGLVQGREDLSEAWKLVGDTSFLGSLVEVEGSRRLANLVAEILGIQVKEDRYIDQTGGDKGDGDQGAMLVKEKLLRCNIAAMEKMVALTEGDRLAHSAAYFNLGLAKYRLAIELSGELSLTEIRSSLECFKKAIYSEPRNFDYWNALGIVTARRYPSVAEKAFSRSLQINERVRYNTKLADKRMSPLG